MLKLKCWTHSKLEDVSHRLRLRSVGSYCPVFSHARRVMTSTGYVMYCIPYVMCVYHVSVPYIMVCILSSCMFSRSTRPVTYSRYHRLFFFFFFFFFYKSLCQMQRLHTVAEC